MGMARRPSWRLLDEPLEIITVLVSESPGMKLGTLKIGWPEGTPQSIVRSANARAVETKLILSDLATAIPAAITRLVTMRSLRNLDFMVFRLG